MKVTVRFFASVREITGTGEMVLELKENETVSNVLKTLKSSFPDFQASNLMLAVNMEYVQPDYKLKNGDVIALIPLVSGG